MVLRQVSAGCQDARLSLGGRHVGLLGRGPGSQLCAVQHRGGVSLVSDLMPAYSRLCLEAAAPTLPAFRPCAGLFSSACLEAVAPTPPAP